MYQAAVEATSKAPKNPGTDAACHSCRRIYATLSSHVHHAGTFRNGWIGVATQLSRARFHQYLAENILVDPGQVLSRFEDHTLPYRTSTCLDEYRLLPKLEATGVRQGLRVPLA